MLICPSASQLASETLRPVLASGGESGSSSTCSAPPVVQEMCSLSPTSQVLQSCDTIQSFLQTLARHHDSRMRAVCHRLYSPPYFPSILLCSSLLRLWFRVLACPPSFPPAVCPALLDFLAQEGCNTAPSIVCCSRGAVARRCGGSSHAGCDSDLVDISLSLSLCVLKSVSRC